MPPADVVIIEGILVLHMPEIRQMLNMKVYVDTDDDVRLARRSAQGRGIACQSGIVWGTAAGSCVGQPTHSTPLVRLPRPLQDTARRGGAGARRRRRD